MRLRLSRNCDLPIRFISHGSVCVPPDISADRHPTDHGVVPEACAAMSPWTIDVWHYDGWIFIADAVRARVVAPQPACAHWRATHDINIA